jgi:hemerythrin superfamily protein
MATTTSNTAKSGKATAGKSVKSQGKLTSQAKTPNRNATTKSRGKEDAVTILKSDHDKVKKLFKQFEKISQKPENEGKVAIANEICMELLVHAKTEEEVFYPAAREYLDDDDMMNEAVVEHASATDLIAQIQTMDPEDDLYDAKVTVLGEYIDHHVKEEEEEMFPKLRKTKIDLKALGEQLIARKQELTKCFMDVNGALSEEYLKMFALKSQTKH